VIINKNKIQIVRFLFTEIDSHSNILSMKDFENILFVVSGNDLAEAAFSKAASISQSENSKVTFLVLHPNFSGALKDIQSTYESSLEDAIRQKLRKHNLPQDAPVLFETAAPHFVTIIQHVLRGDYDLVIKSAEKLEKKDLAGFKSIDMSLLRKCPCPVWLCRDSEYKDKPKILTAIDPFSETPEGHDLSVKLLEIGQDLAQSLGGSNAIVSCWDFEYEDFLRNAPFAKMDGSKVDALIVEAEHSHKQALDKIILEADVGSYSIICERGKTSDVIPALVERENIDMVVMGTVARTGVPGFIIGNTAENILQSLSCSMFAVKPSGFVSPIKAY
jgi:nucleotide-binding universal stress UspA family protein